MTAVDVGVEPDETGDGDLIEGVRNGDTAAFEALYRRHSAEATRVARAMCRSPQDAEDAVAEAFVKTYRSLVAGDGPTNRFRAYLLTVVRNAVYDRGRRDRKLQVTDDDSVFDAPVEQPDPAVAEQERAMVVRALGTLPKRWQEVLWYTEVEGLRSSEVAEIVGMSPNATSALAVRAREGLRQAYLQQHIGAEGLDERCRRVVTKLAAFTRARASRGANGKIAEHLQTCPTCAAFAHEMKEINGGFRAATVLVLLSLPVAARFARARHAVTGSSGSATATAAAPASTGATVSTASKLGQFVHGLGMAKGALAIAGASALTVTALAGSAALHPAARDTAAGPAHRAGAAAPAAPRSGSPASARPAAPARPPVGRPSPAVRATPAPSVGLDAARADTGSSPNAAPAPSPTVVSTSAAQPPAAPAPPAASPGRSAPVWPPVATVSAPPRDLLRSRATSLCASAGPAESTAVACPDTAADELPSEAITPTVVSRAANGDEIVTLGVEGQCLGITRQPWGEWWVVEQTCSGLPDQQWEIVPIEGCTSFGGTCAALRFVPTGALLDTSYAGTNIGTPLVVGVAPNGPTATMEWFVPKPA